jgi:ABC-type polysaccharide/polyol phosphate export permease
VASRSSAKEATKMNVHAAPEPTASRRSWFAVGAADLVQGLGYWRVSHLMGLNEIRRRYARSRIGQFWLTILTGIMVTSLGVVWATLWKVHVADLLPFIAISLILWTMISGVLAEATTVFVTAGPFFLNQGMSFSTAIYALVYRHLLIFLHNLPIVIIAMLVFSVPIGATALLALAGLALLLLLLVWASYVAAIACLRFRDLTQLLQGFLLIAFFVTPVLWKPEQIPADKQHFLSLNPFAAMLAVVREPLLGQLPTLHDWLSAVMFSIGGFVISMPLIGYCRRRIIYWI